MNKSNRNTPRGAGKVPASPRDLLGTAQAILTAAATAYSLIAPHVRKWRRNNQAKKAAKAAITPEK